MIPAEYSLGSEPPSSKPNAPARQNVVVEKSAKELKVEQKAARKKELAEKKAARLAKKAATTEGSELECGSAAENLSESKDTEDADADTDMI